MQNNLSELIKIIEEKANVSEILSDYITLEKKGNNHMGLCPFHSDSNPSMSVSDTKGIFKCFVCGAGGGAISFVQNYEGIPFIEAVKKISDKLNINWRQYISQREVKLNPEEVRGWEINQEALNFFKYNLNNTTNNAVKAYTESRGITKEVIEKFDIGFSGEGLSNFLLNKDFTEDEIVKYGLAKRREDTTLQDYFINRLIFTIKNKDGKIVGFSGRVIEASKYAKYMNSPETPVFKKSSILYNFDKAKISANLKKQLIIVEGFMDVIALSKAGVENTIATMGTAFTAEHNKIIKSITNNVVLAFDSDVAGINATISTGKALINDHFNIEVVTIPSGKDFDELLKQGVESVSNTLNEKQKFINFYKDMIFKKLDAQGDNVSFDVLKELLKLLAKHDDKFAASNIINDIAERYKIDKELLMEEFNSYSKTTKQSSNQSNNISGGNMAPPPFIEEWVPTPPTTEETTLRKVVDTISKDDNRHPRKLWLSAMEEEIVSYAITHDYAYNYLITGPIVINMNEDTAMLWKEFVNSKQNNRNIEDEVIASRIAALLEKNRTKNNLSDITNEITDEKTFIELVNKYKHVLLEFNKDNLKRAIENETDFEEKQHLFAMLSKLI